MSDEDFKRIAGEFIPDSANGSISITNVDDFKTGEISPKERQIALRNIRYQRNTGRMPKDVLPLEIGVSITINGRHFSHLGVTAGVKKGGYKITPHDIWTIAARLFIPIIETPPSNRKDFSASEYALLVERDGCL